MKATAIGAFSGDAMPLPDPTSPLHQVGRSSPAHGFEQFRATEISEIKDEMHTMRLEIGLLMGRQADLKSTVEKGFKTVAALLCADGSKGAINESMNRACQCPREIADTNGGCNSSISQPYNDFPAAAAEDLRLFPRSPRHTTQSTTISDDSMISDEVYRKRQTDGFAASRSHSKQRLLDQPDELASRSSTKESIYARATWMTKSSFGSIQQTQKDDMLMLMHVFEVAEAREERVKQEQLAKQHPISYYCLYLRKMDKEDLEMLIDSIVCIIIFMNAVFIGISMDYENERESFWMIINILFSFVFWIELGVKISLNGIIGHFGGPNKTSNTLDFCLICIDLLQLMLVVFFADAADGMSNAPSASLFRIVRLAKLIRVLRLLKSPVFKDLLSMMQGMLGGMSTLIWSMVLFVLVVYVVALLFREILGRKTYENVTEYFDSVPRSMLTTFRCSFGDCSTAGGVPIFEFANESYGGVCSFFYCIFVFVITIGLFNVISAIFVESTMEAAAALQYKKKKARLSDDVRWSSNCATLVRRLLSISPKHSCPENLSEAIETIYEVEVQGKIVDEFTRDEKVKNALDELDIDPEDHEKLSDILDPDNGGTIRVIELLDGIRRLRGEPRRSDIVTVDLMIRSIQRDVMYIKSKLASRSNPNSA